MTYTLTSQLDKLAKLRHEAPEEIIVEALEQGIAKLYQESVLALYLKKRLSRQKAIRLVGFEPVKTAELQWQTVRKDIAWGLKRG